MVLGVRYQVPYLFSSVSAPSNARHPLTHILGDSQNESPEWWVHAGRAGICIPRCLNRHVSCCGETSDIVRMRRPFPACSQEPSHGSGPVPESLRPATIQFSISGMHRTQRIRRHESFRSALLWFRVRAITCSGAARNVHPACSWIRPCIVDAAKSLVVSVKRGAESAAFCGACQMSRSDRAGLVDVVLMNGRVDVHALHGGLERYVSKTVRLPNPAAVTSSCHPNSKTLLPTKFVACNTKLPSILHNIHTDVVDSSTSRAQPLCTPDSVTDPWGPPPDFACAAWFQT